MIFNEINIRTIEKDGSLYVNVLDLAKHLDNATKDFAAESKNLSEIIQLTEEESAFIMGLINGMYNVVIMLSQGNDEHEMSNINTVEELLERFNHE